MRLNSAPSVPPRRDVPRSPDNWAQLEDITCPLTKKIMKDPVVATNGRTYERAAIESWLTETQCPIKRLVPNLALKAAIDAYGRDRESSFAAFPPSKTVLPQASVGSVITNVQRFHPDIGSVGRRLASRIAPALQAALASGARLPMSGESYFYQKCFYVRGWSSQGTLTAVNFVQCGGTSLTGHFDSQINGHGCLTTPLWCFSGWFCEGQPSASLPGRLDFADNSAYEGPFKLGRPHGSGKVELVSGYGQFYDAIFSEGQLLKLM